ncbi:serine protease [Iningainema tapete]|uniref:Tetratricopeptide repeat protein n=1 Tax=Iningainema tapete BLCC-T55 TaxID=2748662 RepID=A0A8J7BZF4_9CYAN|nr:serine protease [Iningainema tapete]MBD2775758.1 tetratricopeptide repeat protein [Iningainema tapete BLCC-T55]
MKYHQSPLLIGVSIALIQPQIAVATSATEVSKIGKEVTVLIQSQNKPPRYGSGVIIKRLGNTYTVLTAAHVVNVADKYEIVTSDGQRYLLNYSKMKQLKGVDLAVTEFTSSRNYTVAKIGNSDASTEGAKVYVTGYPEPTFAINQSIYTFTTGDITANATKALRDGYALVYNNDTKKGMSGGAVINDKGELIGIHGRADTDTKETKTGFNLGIPINTFLRLFATTGLNVGVSAPNTQEGTKSRAANFYLQGGDKRKQKDYRGAIVDYNEAIRLNPQYTFAYNDRGISRIELGDYQRAIADFNSVLKINPNYALAYYNRGLTRNKLGDKQGAIADYTSALRINPNYTQAYNNRGDIRNELGDNKGALEDLNSALLIDPNYDLAYLNRSRSRIGLRDYQGAIADANSALRINPNYAKAFYNRGIARNALRDYQGAISDYDSALRIDPNYGNAYINRSQSRIALGDYKGAIADTNSALRIDPKSALAYNNRGLSRSYLGDKQGAISDYTQALRIDPKYALSYRNRGRVRADLGDKQGALVDFQKAADLYQQQGKIPDYQKTLEYMRKFQ